MADKPVEYSLRTGRSVHIEGIHVTFTQDAVFTSTPGNNDALMKLCDGGGASVGARPAVDHVSPADLLALNAKLDSILASLPALAAGGGDKSGKDKK